MLTPLVQQEHPGSGVSDCMPPTAANIVGSKLGSLDSPAFSIKSLKSVPQCWGLLKQLLTKLYLPAAVIVWHVYCAPQSTSAKVGLSETDFYVYC